MHSFPKAGAKIFKKRNLNMKVYCIIPLKYQLPDIQRISKSNYIIFKKD